MFGVVCYAAMDILNNTDLCKASMTRTAKSHPRDGDLAHPTRDYKIGGRNEIIIIASIY